MTHRISYDETPIEATITSKAFWLQTLDRSVKTAFQSSAVFFGAGIPIANIDWKQATVSVLVTVAITILLSVTSSKLYEVENFYIDLIQRAARTFLATFIGSLVTLDSLASADWGGYASLAAGATFLSIVTSMGSRNLGAPETASVFVRAELVPVAIEQATNAIVETQQAVGTWYEGERERITGQVEDVRNQAQSYMNSLQRPPQ